MDEGLKFYELAVKGSRQDLKKAFDFFEALYNEDPSDPDITAYYADCLSLMSRDSTDTNTLFGNAIKSIKLFDEAINADPENMNIRILRVKQSLRLPESFFKRTATAINDLEFLLDKYEKNSGSVSEEQYFEILYLFGKCYLRLGMKEEAMANWNRLIEVGSDSPYHNLVDQEMKNIASAAYKIDIKATSDLARLFKEGIRLHNLGVEGNADAAVKAKEVLQKVYDQAQKNPLVEAYYGSSIALVGKYSTDSQTMFGSAIQGMKLLNHAVEADSSNPKLRYLRGNLLYSLPESFFHTSEKAAKDFKFVAAEHERNPDILSKDKYWQMLYDLGVCYERMNQTEQALKVWKKLLRITNDPKYQELLAWSVEGGSES